MIFLNLLDLQSNTSQYDFFFFYEPSQYDMIHDRKNQTQASFFTRGANLSNPNIQLVKVYSVPNSLSHRKCP